MRIGRYNLLMNSTMLSTLRALALDPLWVRREIADAWAQSRRKTLLPPRPSAHPEAAVSELTLAHLARLTHPPAVTRSDTPQRQQAAHSSETGASVKTQCSATALLLSTGSVASPDTRPDVRAQAIARMDWVELEQAVVACTACDLCKTRQRTVFGVGYRTADWALVGEAPGAEEDRLGEPFVGLAGKLLDNILRAAGRARDAEAAPNAVFILNAIKCRPPQNRNPTPEEMATCTPFLHRQLELLRPRLIVASGRIAAQAVLGQDESIARLRGRVHAYRNAVETSSSLQEKHALPSVVVTYHPAYLLRQPGEKAKVWQDLRLALRLAATSPEQESVSAPAIADPAPPASFSETSMPVPGYEDTEGTDSGPPSSM